MSHTVPHITDIIPHIPKNVDLCQLVLSPKPAPSGGQGIADVAGPPSKASVLGSDSSKAVISTVGQVKEQSTVSPSVWDVLPNTVIPEVVVVPHSTAR